VLDATSGRWSARSQAWPACTHSASCPVGKGFITQREVGDGHGLRSQALKSTGEIRSTGKNPDALIYDPASRRLFVLTTAAARSP